MSDLVLNYLNNNKCAKNNKIILKRALAPKTKVVFLDRQVIKYFTDFEKYSDQKIIDFRNQVLDDYDKSSNVISLITAFYEGGTGVFEAEFKKRRTANRDLKGIDQYFKYARVDEEYIFKNIKTAAIAFTLDSGVRSRNKKYEAVIRKTYEIYIYLKANGFKGVDVIDQAKKLKDEMDKHKVSIGDPIAQYCFSLLTNYQNAKKIFKVKGLSNKSEEEINERIYNSYSDLRVLLFTLEAKSHMPKNVEVCFVSNDAALNQFNSEFKNSVNKMFVQKDELDRNTNWFNFDINFDIFNSEIFSENELSDFKDLFFKWSDMLVNK